MSYRTCVRLKSVRSALGSVSASYVYVVAVLDEHRGTHTAQRM